MVRKVLVTGAGGLLGGAVAKLYGERGVAVDAFDHATLDITNGDAVHEAIERAQPDVVVHCAAMTNVDACEEHPDEAFAVNGEGSRTSPRQSASARTTSSTPTSARSASAAATRCRSSVRRRRSARSRWRLSGVRRPVRTTRHSWPRNGHAPDSRRSAAGGTPRD